MGKLIESGVFLSKQLEKLNPTDTGKGLGARTEDEEKADIEMTAEEKAEKIKRLEENIITYIQMTFEGFLQEINGATKNKTKMFDAFPAIKTHLEWLENFYLKLRNIDKGHPLVHILENLQLEKNKDLPEINQNNEQAMKEFKQYLQSRK